MKKLLALALSLVLALSTMSICAFAVDAPEAPAGWAEFGEIEVDYDSTLADKITFDGDLADWEGIATQVIDANNLYAWANTTVPEDFSITTYFAADAQYLYVAFWIMDSNPVAAPSSDSTYNYGGYDSFQISLDFSKAFAKNDDYYTRAIFYSFALREDKVLAITADNREQDGFGDTWVMIANEADEDGKIPLKGAVGVLEGGWQAEFAISWQTLYADANYKLVDWDKGAEGLTFELGPDTPLEVGALVCYLNYAPKTEGEGNDLICAAGSSKYYTLGDGGQFDGFFPVNHGLSIKVKADEKVNVDIETNKNNPDNEETEAPTDKNPSGDKNDATETPTEAPTEAATTGNNKNNNNNNEEKTGCKSVAGAGIAAVLMSALGVGIVYKKKKD